MPLLRTLSFRWRSTPWSMRLVLVAIGIIAAWSLAWAFAAQATTAVFDGWLTAEAEAGRQWTCPDRRIEGYPFAFRLHCERPTFHGEVTGHPTVGSMEGLTAGMELDEPGALVVTLRGPLNLRAEDDSFEAELSWADLGLLVPGILGAPTGGSVKVDRLAVSVSARGEGDLNLRTAHLSADVAGVPASPTDKSFSFVAQGLAFPTADALPGLDIPADATGQGVLRDATLLGAPTVRQLEAWRLAGGALALAALTFRKGSFSGSAQGALALDEEHRPSGQLDTVLAGFAPVAKRFGIPVAGLQLGGLLSTVLSGGKAAPAGSDSLQLPLVLADGRVSVGPFATGVRLPPLY